MNESDSRHDERLEDDEQRPAVPVDLSHAKDDPDDVAHLIGADRVADDGPVLHDAEDDPDDEDGSTGNDEWVATGHG